MILCGYSPKNKCSRPKRLRAFTCSSTVRRHRKRSRGFFHLRASTESPHSQCALLLLSLSRSPSHARRVWDAPGSAGPTVPGWRSDSCSTALGSLDSYQRLLILMVNKSREWHDPSPEITGATAPGGLAARCVQRRVATSPSPRVLLARLGTAEIQREPWTHRSGQRCHKVGLDTLRWFDTLSL